MPTKETQFPSLVISQMSRAKQRILSTSAKKSSNWVTLRDTQSFVLSYWLGVACLLQGHPWSPGVVGCFRQLLGNVESCSDYLGLIESCNDLYSQLCEGRTLATLIKGKTRWSRSLIRILRMVYPEGVLHPHPEFNQLLTFLGWLKRVPVFIRSSDEAKDEYLANEARLRSLTFDEARVDQLREIWIEFFGEFRLTRPFLPRHGPGSTADAGRVTAEKWRLNSADCTAHVLLKGPDLEPLVESGSGQRVAKVTFVPKQAGKDRTICMEPAWLMYLQQGVRVQLEKFVSTSKAKDFFLLNDLGQEANRKLCYRAYLEGFSTLDLSAASDSVSWDLIGRISKGTRLYGYLKATRSTQARIGRKVIDLAKFAPMGSALCFLVECMLFTCICELAYRMHYGQPSRGRIDAVSIFGDDIICPSEIYDLVVELLTSFGFVVNEAKSFKTGPYFESCGAEALYGAPILRPRHPRSHLSYDKWGSPEQVGTVTDLANTLLDFGYYTARRCLLKYWEGASIRCGHKSHAFTKCVDWSDTGIRSLHTPSPPLKWDPHLMRSYYEVWEVVVETAATVYDIEQYRCSMLLHGFTVSSAATAACSGTFGLTEYPAGTCSYGTFSHPRKWREKTKGFLLQNSCLIFDELLVLGEITCASVCRTGRLRQRWALKRHYVG